MLIRHMLSCKDVAHVASDYLDKHVDGKLNWKIRLHLLACSNCRRFVRHLKITRQIAPQFIKSAEHTLDVDVILQRIKEKLNAAQE